MGYIMESNVHNIAYAMYIDWHLLYGCNHYCDYDHEPPEALSEKFDRQNILNTAFHFLSLNRNEYTFNIYGGEPTIHPYLDDLLNYIFTSGRNCKIILNTNGLRSINYYARLFGNVPVDKLKLVLNFHYKYADLKKLLVLVASTVEHQQQCGIVINYVPQFDPQIKKYCLKLLQFRKNVPFGLNFQFSYGKSKIAWLEDLADAFSTFESHTGNNSLCLPDNAAPGTFSCAGTNSAHITPEGRFTIGLAGEDYPFKPCIVKNALFRKSMPQAPAFASVEAAGQWLARFKVEALRQELRGGPARSPFQDDSTDRELRNRLKRIQPWPEESAQKIQAFPDLWENRKEDIEAIYGFLPDEDSRDLFLRILEMNMLGDMAWFGDMSRTVNMSGHDETENIIRAGACASMEEFEARVLWSRKSFEMAAQHLVQFLDSLVRLHASFPAYRIFLKYDGKNVFICGDPIMISRYRPRAARMTEHFQLSLVVCCSGENQDLAELVEQNIRQFGDACEIIFLLDENTPKTEIKTANSLACLYPLNTRVYHFGEALNRSSLWNCGLEFSKGSFILFVRSLPDPELLEYALSVISVHPEIDMILFSADQAGAQVNSGASLFTLYLANSPESPDFYDKGITD